MKEEAVCVGVSATLHVASANERETDRERQGERERGERGSEAAEPGL